MDRLRVLRSRVPFPLVLVMFFALLVLPVMVASPARADLCAEQPTPVNPWSDSWSVGSAPPADGANVTVDPPEDPFKDGSKTRLSSWYGFQYQITSYDASCNWGTDGIFRTRSNMESSIFNLAGLPFGLAQGVTVLSLQPSWRGTLDQAVESVTQALGDGIWTAFAGLGVTLAAVIAMWIARTGDISRVITQALWVVAVMAIAGVSITNSSFLTGSVDKATDEVVSVAGGTITEMGGGAASKDESETKSVAVSNTLDSIDAMNRDIMYRGWLEAQLGSADNVASTKHGEALYKSMHLTWWEGRAVLYDPSGKGKEIIDQKKENFKNVVAEIEKDDPQAFEYLKGKETSRTGVVIMTLLQAYLSLAFFIVAMAAVGVALMTIRLLVMMLPVIGLAGLLEQTRPWFMGILQKYSGNLVKAPLSFCAAIVNVTVLGALFNSSLPSWSKLFLAVVMMVLLWGLFKPQVLPVPIAQKGFSMARRATTYLAGMVAGRAARPREDAPAAPEKSSKQKASPSPSDAPVAGSQALPAGAPEPKQLPASQARRKSHPFERQEAGPAPQAQPQAAGPQWVPVVRTDGPRELPPGVRGEQEPPTTQNPRVADDGDNPAAGTTGAPAARRPRIGSWEQDAPAAAPSGPQEGMQHQDDRVRVVYSDGRAEARQIASAPRPTAHTAEAPKGAPAEAPTEAPKESPMVSGYERVKVRDAPSSSGAVSGEVWAPRKSDGDEDARREGVSESNLRRQNGKPVFQVFTPRPAGDGGRSA